MFGVRVLHAGVRVHLVFSHRHRLLSDGGVVRCAIVDQRFYALETNRRQTLTRLTRLQDCVSFIYSLERMNVY